ncbi:MAG: acetate--CoA ligase family protein [Planctomycetes bacterium]|nr:acetate--CoA ligase family protein [Planctomycetota bacterium]
MTVSLDAFFSPRSVAVVGASTRETSVGHAVLKNLLEGGQPARWAPGPDGSRGFAGKVFAVNRKGGEILGVQANPSLTEIGEPVDLVVIAIPPRYIKGVIEECGSIGTQCVIVISAGFAELGEEGRKLQDELTATAAEHGIRIIGPNCLGVIRPAERLNASFGAGAPPAGPIGLLSQSGALVTGLISYTEREGFGLSAAISLGSKADVTDVEVVEWLARDEQTRAIAVYVEAFPDPHAFMEVARRVSAEKPIVALKGGATAAGAAAASSHTGSLAGSAAAYSAAFRQTGVLQAERIGEFMAWTRALAYQPPAKGDRIAIVTNAGGPGVLSADAAARAEIKMATLSEETLAKLNEVLPSVWSHNNPIDIIGDATPERFAKALEIVGQAPEVDGVVVIMTVQAMTNPADVAEAISNACTNWEKPILASFLGLVGTAAGEILDRRGIPEFNLPEEAVSAMGALVRRGQWLSRDEPEAFDASGLPAPDHARAQETLDRAAALGQSNLDLTLASEVLKAAGLRYNKSETAKDEDEAAARAEEIGYPVVIKLISPDVVHKSDAGGVVLDVVGPEAVRAACASIRTKIEESHPGARIEGFTIEEQVGGTEIIIGMSRDPGFGPLFMVGMGGVFVEVYKDVAFRISPFSRRDALDMIGEIQAQPLLNGARGRPVLNRDELAEAILRVEALVEACPAIVELDVNPLVITPDRGLVCIDARVII